MEGFQQSNETDFWVFKDAWLLCREWVKETTTETGSSWAVTTRSRLEVGVASGVEAPETVLWCILKKSET